MAMSDLRLALISFMESFWDLQDAARNVSIVLVEKAKVELAWDQFF